MRDLKHCSALLFDGSHADAGCRLYTHARKAWLVEAPLADNFKATQMTLHATLDDIDLAARSGVHIVLSLSYEASQAFAIGEQTIGHSKPQAHTDIPKTPWLQALAFDATHLLTCEQALAHLKEHATGSTAQLITPQSQVDVHEFTRQIDRIRSLIAAGDTYQVNYTFPFTANLHTHSTKHPDAALAGIYHDWVKNLRIPYGAFLMLPHSSVLSFSPELFVELKGDSLTCRPMKGTAAVGDNDNDTTRRAAQLAADPKNRAENLMIVDLMRNDLSRLAQTRAVRVPKLFEVKRYGAVLQMTSTVRADLNGQPNLNELFEALFPCGSITGAPKRRTMEIIEELEPFARGTYCGTIGYLTPTLSEPAQGRYNAVFSVPIRTLESTAAPIMSKVGSAIWPIQCNVGAGITYDSNAEDEWQESLLKAKFFTQHGQDFEIIETMRAEQVNGTFQIPLLEQHIARMGDSATAFDLPCSAAAFKQTVQNALENAQSSEDHALRLRIGLQANESFKVSLTALEDIPAVAQCAIYPIKTDSNNPFLRHKTSVRALYNAALAEAKQNGLFDYLFLNETGEITEGARTSIFIKLNGMWLTPPLSCGLLPSIARAQILDDPTFATREQTFGLSELQQAEEILLCNALYKVKAVLQS